VRAGASQVPDRSQLISEKRPLTGRAVERRRLRTDECESIDMTTVRHIGALEAPFGRGGWVRWRGQTTHSAFAVLGTEELGPRALLIVDHPEDAPRTSFQIIELTSTVPYYGGVRLWLRCPARGCQRRVRLVYRPRGNQRFACRRCWGLTYRGQQQHRLASYEGLERPLEVLLALEPRLQRARGSRSQRKFARRVLRACQAAARYNGRPWPPTPAVGSKLDRPDG
jgi:hypothetical protein